MKSQNLKIISLSLLLLLIACENSSDKVSERPFDLYIHGGPIYTADSKQPQVEAVGVVDGKIIFAGKISDAQKYISKKTKTIDLKDRCMTPGFIESHAHFMGMGYLKSQINLIETESLEEILEMVAEAVKKAKPGQWIVGRGWHQSKWKNPPNDMFKGFPTHQALSAISPDNPVYLKHASGHASFANAKAMEICGVNAQTIFPDRGEVYKNKNGQPTGVFNENAMALITRHIPESDAESQQKAFDLATQECLENGITSFTDAGVEASTLVLYQKYRAADKLGLRFHLMLDGGDTTLLKTAFADGPVVDDWLNIRAIKLVADGALGSRGAWLLAPYSDRPQHLGLPQLSMDYILEVSKKSLQNGFQLGIHCIGDRANREILDQYETAFQAFPQQAKDCRFRVEHAQHLDKADIPRFAQLNIIASMQGIHLSSDRPWAINRLGLGRIKEGAYVWQKLLQSGVPIINGTDSPVEPVNPLACFYASVSRRTLKGEPQGGYEADQKMSRQEALKSYTLDAAYGMFREDKIGSITVGKFADFAIFSQDIMTIPEDQILKTNCVMTIVDGKPLGFETRD